MATLLSDNFDRANNTTAPGSPTTGGPYTAQAGTWGIISNQLYTSSTTTNAVLTYPAAANVDATVTLATLTGNYIGVVVRYVDVNNYWMAGESTGGFILLNRRGGTNYVVYQTTGSANGDVIRLVAYGKYLYLFRNSTFHYMVEDMQTATHTAATPAGFYANSTTSLRLDNATTVDATATPITSSFTGGDELSDNASDYYLESDRIAREGNLYKGRDTRLLDAGSVA